MSYHTLFCLFMAMGELYLRKSEGLLRENQCELPKLLTNNAKFLEAMGEKEKADAASRKALENEREAEIAKRKADEEAERKRLQGLAAAAEAGKGEANAEADRLRREAAEREAALRDLERRLAEAERLAAEAAKKRGDEEEAEKRRRAAEEAERLAAEAERRRLEDERAAAAALRAQLDAALRALEFQMGLLDGMKDPEDIMKDSFEKEDIDTLDGAIRKLADLKPTETKYTDGITKGATLKEELLRRLASRKGAASAAAAAEEAKRNSLLGAAAGKVKRLILDSNAAKDNKKYDTIPQHIEWLQAATDALEALGPPAGSEYEATLQKGRATIADLRAFLWEKQQQNARAAEEAAAAAAAAAAAPAEPAAPAQPAGPMPYERVAGQAAGLMISGSSPKQFIQPDIMLEVKQAKVGNRIAFQNKYSMVRSHFGLLLTEVGTYDEKDFIDKMNEQFQVMKRKAAGRPLQAPSYVISLGGKLKLNDGSFFKKGTTLTMAGGGSRSNRTRATRATRKRRHN